MIRVLLDANILFSAAYRPGRRLSRLWQATGIELVSSAYVLGEAVRNIKRKYPAQMPVLQELLRHVHLVGDESDTREDVFEIDPKDLPVLRAAIASRSTYLITGDGDFDRYFGTTIEGVTVLRPTDLLDVLG